ncbi:MAG: hypothetical protein ACPGU1_19910 [Myxococcota bacterium]
MRLSLHIVSIALCVTLCPISSANAEGTPPPAQKLLAESAEVELEAGRYSQAAQEFDAAYRIRPTGALCMKSANAFRRADALLKARERYYACLEAPDLSPDARRRASMILLDILDVLKASNLTPDAQTLSPNAPRTARKAAPAQVQVQMAPEPPSPLPAQKTHALRYTQRALTLPGGSWSLAAGMGVGQQWDSDETSLGLTAAFSYGVVDAFELGAFLMQLQLLERVVYDRPSIYAIAELFEGEQLTIGAKLEVVAGVQSYSPWRITVGLPQSYYPVDIMRIDVGAYIVFVMSDTRLTNLQVPVALNIQATDALFASLSTALILTDGTQLVLPLGAGLGYTFEREERPLCDLRAEFQWPLFHQPDSDRPIDITTFTTEVNVRCYLYD